MPPIISPITRDCPSLRVIQPHVIVTSMMTDICIRSRVIAFLASLTAGVRPFLCTRAAKESQADWPSRHPRLTAPSVPPSVSCPLPLVGIGGDWPSALHARLPGKAPALRPEDNHGTRREGTSTKRVPHVRILGRGWQQPQPEPSTSGMASPRPAGGQQGKIRARKAPKARVPGRLVLAEDLHEDAIGQLAFDQVHHPTLYEAANLLAAQWRQSLRRR